MRSWLAGKLAYPVYVGRFVRRHKSIRGVLINAAIFLTVGFAFWPETTVLALSLALRGVTLIGFMVIQFVGLFWFLSRSKSVTILPGETGSLTLDDYKGQPSLLALMGEWIDILQGNKNFRQMGGIAPSGMILHGEPGTGKSYLMKCVAGSAGIAFHSLDGASFSAMFIGVPVLKTLAYVNKVRSLAREYGSAIGYIDEIDALGSARGGQQGGLAIGGFMGGSGGMGALTTLLSEIDGMGTERNMTVAKNVARRWLRLPPIHEGTVFWTGGTNRPEVLDKALTRPGRMEHLIKVDVPDAPGRRAIFGYYAAKVKHQAIDVDRLVSSTQGITPAAIQSALQRGAPRIANAAKRSEINEHDVMTAIMEGIVGIPNPIGDLPREQKYQLAVHEASHCVASHHLSPAKLLAFVSIVRRGAALGFMLPVNKDAVYTYPMADIIRDIRVSLAGDIGTKVILGERWVGGAGDFQHVRQRVAYLDWHGVFGGVSPEYGKPTKDAQERIDRWLKEQMDATESLLQAHRAEVVALADALVEREELSGEEATQILEGRALNDRVQSAGADADGEGGVQR